MTSEPKWVESTDDLVRELGNLGPGAVSVDTEADSMHHFREKVCLIQISAGGVDLLIDPLGGCDVSALGPLLADPARRKILHGADYDLRMLGRDFSFEVRGLYDTMVAARLVGESSFGLAALVEKHFGIRLDKRFQRADWSRRPLSAPMRQYAAADTRHLEALAAILDRTLEATGRSAWAAEEFQRLEQVRPRPRPADDEAFRRIKGASRLQPRALAVLREVARLRDDVARERDWPRFRVVRNEVLLSLADAAAKQPVDASSFRGLPRSWRNGRSSALLQEAIDRARALPEDQLPERLRRTRTRRDPVKEARVRDFCRERDRLAQRLGIEPSVIAARAVLEEVVERLARGEGPGEGPGFTKLAAKSADARIRGPVAASRKALRRDFVFRGARA